LPTPSIFNLNPTRRTNLCRFYGLEVPPVGFFSTWEYAAEGLEVSGRGQIVAQGGQTGPRQPLEGSRSPEIDYLP